MRAFIFAILFLSGCAAHQQFVSVQRDQVFPNGVYTHQVRLEFPNQKSIEFKGIVNVTATEVTVIGLSVFQTTLFRISEVRETGNVRVDLFHDSLKGKEKFFKEFYVLLRSVLLFSKSPQKNQKVKVLSMDDLHYPLQLSTEWQGNKVLMELNDYDQNHIPRTIKMEHPKFKVVAKVSDYEI